MADRKLVSFMVVSGEPEKLYMSIITAIGFASGGSPVYMFFTMDGLKAVSKRSSEIVLPNQKPLSYYVENLIDMGEVELSACEFGMRVKGVRHEDLIEGVKVSGVSEFSYKSSDSANVFVF